jgi:AcrR family transcriptional regulator
MTRREILAQARTELRTLGYLRTTTVALLEAAGVDVETLTASIMETM